MRTVKNICIIFTFFVMTVQAKKIDDTETIRGTGVISSGAVEFEYIIFGADSSNADFNGAEAGLDQLYEYGWFFRVVGDTAETSFNAPTLPSTYIGDTATLNWVGLGGGVFDATETTVVNEIAIGSGTLTTDLLITNTSAVDQTINFYHFADADVGGSDIGDDAVLTNSPDFMTITDTTAGQVMEYRAGGNGFFEVAPFGAGNPESNLTDGDIDNFANTGLPATNIDFTGGFQWMDIVIPAGGTATFGVSLGANTPAPIPTDLVVAGPPIEQNIAINEVFYQSSTGTGDWAELINRSSAPVDITGWRWCSRFTYPTIQASDIISGNGDLILDPGEIIALSLSIDLDDNAADLGLYTTPPFSDPNNMVDFVQWGTSADVGRSDVAVAKDIWLEISLGVYDFVPTTAVNETLSWCGTESNGTFLTTSLNFSNTNATQGLENNLSACDLIFMDGFE